MHRPLFRTALAVAAAALLGGCPPPAPTPMTDATPRAAAGPLVSSLQVQPSRDSVRLVLQVTNAASTPLEIAFSSGQSYDFGVRAGDRDLWRWSADKGFIQMVRQETLAPGETRTYAETWTPPPGVSGELTATAWLTSSTHPVERTTVFRLP
ncbi:MAG TPA: BsuPI-related putative proteinase inhibitor [Longimicrobium sp.]|nr:BsuPI-related putative proteinase inhibitor [Longimicrobium sp.]